jgi:uncharacterized membrane protein
MTDPAENNASFRWTYIVLPAAILLVSVILAAAFYPRLPEQVAYRFQGGTPGRWLSRAAFITWMVGAQAVLTAGSFFFVRIILLGARYWSVEGAALKKLLPVMGNMAALPQVIILFAMLEVFLYNSYEIKLISVLVFAVIVLVLGGAAIGTLLVRAARQARRPYANTGRE